MKMNQYEPTYRDGIAYQMEMGRGESFDIANYKHIDISADELYENFKRFFPIVRGMLIFQSNLEILGREIGAYGYVKYMPLRKEIKKFRKALTKVLGDEGWEAICQAEADYRKANSPDESGN